MAFAVHPDVQAGATIELLAATMRRGGADPGAIHAMARRKPDGDELRWRLTSLAVAAGARPWIIDWGERCSPAKTAPKGCLLVGMSCYGSNAPQMGAALAKLGLLPLAASGAHADFRLHEGWRFRPHTRTTSSSPTWRRPQGTCSSGKAMDDKPRASCG